MFKNAFVYSFLQHTFFFFGCTSSGVLVPQPGMEPVPPAVEAWRPNHWTAREVPPLYYFSLTHYCLLPGLLLYLPNLSPSFCPYPSSLHYYSWWSDSSDTEVRSCHSSAPVVFCLSKSKVLTMIFSTLDGLVPCHSSDLISHHSPSYSSLSSSPLASVLFLPHIICMARSFTWGLCLIFTLSDRSLMITVYKITPVHCASLMLFFLGSTCHHQDILCIHLYIVCFLSSECKLVPEDRNFYLFCLFYSLLCPQCLEQ